MPELKKVTKICIDCKEESQTYVAVDVNGNEINQSSQYSCKVCWNKKREIENERALQLELTNTRKEQLVTWRKECNLQGIFTQKTFTNFNSKLQPTTYKILKEWDFGKSLVLSSPDIYGIGKTHLVCALVNKIVENEMTADIIGDNVRTVHRYQCPVYITSETKIMARIRATFENQERVEKEDAVYKQLCKIPLLIIDDVGKVKPRDYSFLQGVYFRIIDERYVNEKDIIITTNLSFTELETHIGGACADRLREMCGKDGLIKMIGSSYRRK